MVEQYKIILNEDRNVTLTAFIQAVGGEFVSINERPAIMVIPGGGYNMCSDREAEIVAYSFLHAGYQAFVLRYSIGEHKAWPNPLDDYELAMQTIYKNAEKWHVCASKIALIGFSAGGHLAACAATMSKFRPSAVILGYAALKRDICDAMQDNLPAPIDFIDDKTCPCFLFAARNDSIVDISNTIDFAKELAKKEIMFESHIYSYGGHGFSIGEEYVSTNNCTTRLSDWVSDSIGWLDEVLGKLVINGFTKPKYGRTQNGNRDEVLSINCTVLHLENQPKENIKVVEKELSLINSLFSKTGATDKFLNYGKARLKLIDGLSILGYTSEQIAQLDEQLRKYKNKLID